MKNKKGFTLLEVTVALTIFSIGLIALLVLFPQGARVLKRDVHDQMRHVVAYSVARAAQQQGKAFFESDFFTTIKSYRSDDPVLNDGLFVLNSDTGMESSLVDMEYQVRSFAENEESFSAEIVLKNKDRLDELYRYDVLMLNEAMNS